jgi:fused signal recognition particle receptor
MRKTLTSLVKEVEAVTGEPVDIEWSTADADIVIIDTAGRLQNKTDLMGELDKIRRVVEKQAKISEVLLVLDATTGQNGMSQAKAFAQIANVTGVVLTKLDGTAKGGVVIGISDQFNIPVRFIGVGEQAGDLQVFNRFEFVDSLFAGKTK